MKTFVGILIGLMLVDTMGYIAWSISGQKPIGKFYIGVATEYLINSVMHHYGKQK